MAHRRWGKDEVGLHFTAVAAHQRVGNYWHMLPKANQARKAIWDAINEETGKRRVNEAFPKELRAGTVDNEMKIEFKNGSIWQVVGSDNYNALVGSPPVGCVFSEYALADPQAWAYLAPALEKNGGWALFISTSRGPNHLQTIYDYARSTAGWFAEILPASATPVFQPDQLERIKAELIAQYGATRGGILYAQEYECSFAGLVLGKSVYPDWRRSLHLSARPIQPIDSMVIRGWDNTGLHPAAVITQVGPTGQWLVLHEFVGQDIGIEDFGEAVHLWCVQAFGNRNRYRDIGDPAGKNRDAIKMSPAMYLKRKLGITIEDGIQTFSVRRDAVAGRLSRTINGQPAILVDPSCKVLIAGFEGGYAYPEIGNTGQYKDQPIKDEHADCHDALQYPATRLFVLPKRERKPLPKTIPGAGFRI